MADNHSISKIHIAVSVTNTYGYTASTLIQTLHQKRISEKYYFTNRCM